MAVVAHPKDVQGKTLDAKIVNLTAAQASVNASASPGAKARIDADLNEAQKDAVIHYMNKGRISAASVLSTLS